MNESDWQLMRYFLLWLVWPFMVTLFFNGIFCVWEQICKNTCFKFFAILSFELPPSSRFNLQIYFRPFCQITIIEMPSLIRKEKVTCENCGNQTTRNNIVRHNKSCSAGTFYCTHSPNFSTKSQKDLSYHIAKKHSAPKPVITFKCKLCYQEFPGFYALRQHRTTQHGMQIGSGTRDVDVELIVRDVEDHSFRSCLWDNSNCKAASGISCELIVIFWTKSKYCNSNRVGSKIERPLDSVVGDWEDQDFL